MKWKNLFSIILINIFLLCLVSLFNEYDGMRAKIQRLDAIFDLAVDTALTSTMGSEELFSDKFASEMSSYGFGKSNTSKLLQSETKVFRNHSWVTGNTYFMAMYYTENGYFPTSQSAYNMYASHKDTEDIYEFLFGKAGTSYEDSELAWANKRQDLSSIATRYGTNREAKTTNPVYHYYFKDFYNNIGKYIQSNYMVKEESNGSYVVNMNRTIPTLALMGLELDSCNDVSSSFTADNLTSSVHRGKNNSEYFLTPYSLGVTYVPIEVFKPTLLSHLEQMIRFSKCKVSPKTSGETMSDVLHAYESADGCIPEFSQKMNSLGEATEDSAGWYADDSGNVGTNELQHLNPSNTKTYIKGVTDILNDGQIEYDMESLQVKVDYFLVDFYNNANWKIVNYIEGSTPYSTNAMLHNLPTRLGATDTSENGASRYRIVAKVTAKIKIHIPYESGILTWFVQKTSTKANEHYDVKLWNPDTDSIVQSHDGLWYQYSTFVAITR